MPKYTVIGRWADNDQPFVAHVEAKSEKHAFDALKKKLEVDREAGQDVPTEDGVWVVGVFEGHLQEIGGLDAETLLSEVEPA